MKLKRACTGAIRHDPRPFQNLTPFEALTTFSGNKTWKDTGSSGTPTWPRAELQPIAGTGQLTLLAPLPSLIAENSQAGRVK